MRPYYAGVAQPGRATYQVLPVMETNSNVLWLLTRGSWVRIPPPAQKTLRGGATVACKKQKRILAKESCSNLLAIFTHIEKTKVRLLPTLQMPG